MDEKISINQDIYNVVQSLNPIERLEEIKRQIEDGIKVSKGYTKDSNTGKWLKTNAKLDVELNFELHKKMDTINALTKYFANNTDGGVKKFNKYLLFSNLRELIKKSNIKIGQIEKEAGHQIGYLSRLEKLENSTEPSIEFIMAASDLLKISIDSLVNYDFHSLTETELYLLKVIDKFRIDTLNNKLDWKAASSDSLNEGIRGELTVPHPLFENHEIYFDVGGDYPELQSVTTFNSDAFGPATQISDDCFCLKLKNLSEIYVMSIERLLARNKDKKEYSKEIWIINHDEQKECLISEKKFPRLVNKVETLYDEIKNYVARPKISQSTRVILDGFLNDDFSLDENEEFAF